MVDVPSPPPSDSYLPPPTGNVALIAGATGMVGHALAHALKCPSALGGPWTVYAFARHHQHAGIPNPSLDHFILLDALDPHTTARMLAPLSTHVTHLFWVALAARDTEAENILYNSSMLNNVLSALLSGPSPRLRHVALQTGTKHYMGPNVHPDRVGRIGHVDVPFREDSPRVTTPVFYYALEDILSAYSLTYKLTWVVHRSSIILGASCRSAYNLLLTICMYALISRRLGEQFTYPGTVYTWKHFCDASDAEVLAEQQIWAADKAAAGAVKCGEAFNCTNGDVYTWRSFWKVIAAEFNIPFLECDSDGEGAAWVDWMLAKGPVWDAIVMENRLAPTRLVESACFSAACAVFSFDFQHVCSINKSREFGFYKSVDTLKSVRKWIFRLREMNIIPKY